MTTRLTILAVVAVAALGGCTTAPVGHDWISTAQVQSASFYKFWKAALPLRDGDRPESCYLVDDNLYVTTELGDLFTLRADQGLLRWGAHLTAPDYTIFPPSHVQTPDGTGPVVVATTQDLLVFDRYSGEEVYSAPFPFAPGGGVVGDATRMYVGSSDGHLYSLLWRHAFGEAPLERWRLATHSPVACSPTLLGQQALIFGTQNGTVVSCGPLDKSYQWIFHAQDAIAGDPFVDETGVYVASADRSVYKLNLYNGAVEWRHRLGRPLTDGPLVSQFTCFQRCPGEGIWAIDADTGAEKWQRPDAEAFLAGGLDEAVLLTQGGTVDIVDIATGETKRRFGAGGARVAAANVRDDTVYLVNPNGEVACLKPEGIPYLRRQQVEAARVYLNRPEPRHDATVAAPATTVQDEYADPLRSGRDRNP